VSTPADERRHAPGGEPSWEESWYLDFAAGEGRLGGFVRLALRPGERQAWWWAYVVRRGEPLVAVRDHDIDPPRAPGLEIRASGLWAELTCETPFDHWSVGMEALAVALDDPREAYRGERGQPVPSGLDIEWEAAEEPVALPAGEGYVQGGTVHGDVLVGSERIALDGSGVRAHAWGPRQWWEGGPEAVAHVRLGDGRWVHRLLAAPPTDGGLLLPVEDGGLTLRPVLHAPVVVPGPGPEGTTTRLARALCQADLVGSPPGWGWFEAVAST
jgi:hypothetical protein